MLPVFGHTNPDTDAITSALVYARLLTRQGVEAQAYRLGDLNFETPFVLREAGVEVPPLLPPLEAGAAVALVDHNESSQSVANLQNLTVTRVVDHHKLGDLTTTQPAYLRFEPVGCTATLLLKLHHEAKLPVERTDARLMLSAILSDTLHFRSPTTTPRGPGKRWLFSRLSLRSTMWNVMPSPCSLPRVTSATPRLRPC